MHLKVCEIFRSIQGETTLAGFPSLFIRLAGCNLNCHWCDTPYARSGGDDLSIDEILKKVSTAGWFHHITITGGEPLLQPASHVLIKRLVDNGFSVQVETNGSIDISNVPRPARCIVDVKPPSSGEVNSFLIDNLAHISVYDELKIPIANETDFLFAKNFIATYSNFIKNGVTVNLTPVSGWMDVATLAQWALRENLPIRINPQIHTLIWPKGERRDLL